jgi:parallel beta-helix repeat protein
MRSLIYELKLYDFVKEKGKLRRAIQEMLLVLLMASMFVQILTINPVKAESRFWIVDDDGPADFSTITDAYNSANEGDTVLVKAGIYNENLMITKTRLTLQGENPETTIIDGRGFGSAIYVMVDNVTVTGFTVRNSRLNPYQQYTSSGICLNFGVDFCKINNNVAVNVSYGISSYDVGVGCRNNTISDNRISSDYIGIGLWGASNSLIVDNTISGDLHTGIYLDHPYGNTVANNEIGNATQVEGVDYPPYGMQLWGGSRNRVIGNVIKNISYTGIRLNSEGDNKCTNNIISGNTVSETLEGISVNYGSPSNIVLGNDVSNNIIGISARLSSGNTTVISNHIHDNDHGLEIADSDDCRAYHNEFRDNVVQAWTVGCSIIPTWDDGYPSGGNYWSDYGGQDLDNDGIGDTPYSVDECNQDRYPLMYPMQPQLPTAFFTHSPVPAIAGLPTSFDASGSISNGKEIVLYEFDFGDGKTETTTNPMIAHAFSAYGTYNVTLAVEDSESLGDACWQIVEVLAHDVAVMDVSPSNDWVIEGLEVKINVTITNRGNFTETVTTIVYYNLTSNLIIEALTAVVEPNETKVLTFSWITAGIAPCKYYTITAVALIEYDANLADNVLESVSKIKVRILGDTNGDDLVGIDDIFTMASAFGAGPGHPRWDTRLDLNSDGIIDIMDIFMTALNFGRTGP